MLKWKVILLLLANGAVTEPSRALSIVYQRPYKNIMFIPKVYRRKSRVLFLDEDENHQPYGKGEIDLTLNKNSKIKFDESTDYEFTSPGDGSESPVKSPDEELPSGNERFYEPVQRFRYPKYYQGRFGRPYAPSFGFEPYQTFPSVRNSYYQASGWKARSPRVVFPYSPDSSVHTNSHAGPGGFDNVVFRDQNFGLTDVAADDQALQDIGTGNSDAFAERGKCHKISRGLY